MNGQEYKLTQMYLFWGMASLMSRQYQRKESIFPSFPANALILSKKLHNAFKLSPATETLSLRRLRKDIKLTYTF